MTNTLANPSNFLHVKASPQGGNRVILGLMTCGPDEAVGARITELNIFKDVLDVFQKKGYSELDTARVYLRGICEICRMEEEGLLLGYQGEVSECGWR